MKKLEKDLMIELEVFDQYLKKWKEWRDAREKRRTIDTFEGVCKYIKKMKGVCEQILSSLKYLEALSEEDLKTKKEE